MIDFNYYINYFINTAGNWFYILLFIVIFCETGIVFGIFLPGDSLLFTIGVTSAVTNINIHLATFTIFIAAVLGDSCNYFTGKYVGERLFSPDARFLKTKYLLKTKSFLEKNGKKAIVFSRFVAFVRTLAPFIAGVSGINYKKFVILGAISAAIWSYSITYITYFFSDNSFVKKNLSIIIIIILVIVAVQSLIKHIRNKKKLDKKTR